MIPTTTPTLSVIIPNYNHRAFLPERFKSILEQTAQVSEIIFIDDASTDDSVTYVRGLNASIPIQIVERSTNSGNAFEQWKTGVMLAKGEFVWIAESDDACASQLLEKLLAATACNPTIGIAYSQSKIVDDKGAELESFLNYTNELDEKRWLTDYSCSGAYEASHFLIGLNTIPNVSACIFRRLALLNALIDPIRMQLCGDWLIYARILRNYDVAFVSEQLNHFRRHKKSVRARVNALLRVGESYEVLNYIRENFNPSAEKYEASCRRHFAALNYAISQGGNQNGQLELQQAFAKAERFDPLIRLRLLPSYSASDLRVTFAGRGSIIIGKNPQGISYIDGQWSRVRAGPFRGRIEVNPLGQRGIVTIRDARFIRARGVVTTNDMWPIKDFGLIEAAGDAHILSNAAELEIFSLGPNSRLYFETPASIDSDDEFFLEMEIRSTTRDAFSSTRSIEAGNRTELSTINGRRQVLFILPSLDLGGADCINLQILRGLVRKGEWEPIVVTTRKSEDLWISEFLSVCAQTFRLHSFLKYSDYLDFLRLLIDSRRPDLIFVSNSMLGYRLLPWLKERLPEVPIVDLVHLVTEDWQFGGYPRLSIKQQAWLDRTIAVSEDLRDWLISHGRERSSVSVFYATVDTNQWTRSAAVAEDARKRWNIESGKPILLFVGRFCEQKQCKLLLPIIKGLIDRNLDFCLLLAGEGPDRQWLDENICGIFPQHARMLGGLKHSEIRMLMNLGDILLLPSKMEGIALVLFEAMSMGIIPIATDVGGQREIVTTECGVLLKNSPSLAQEMVSAIEEVLLDPAKRDRLAKAARCRMEFLNIQGQIDSRMSDLFSNLIGNRKARLRSSTGLTTKQVARSANQAIEETLSEELASDVWAEMEREGRGMPAIISSCAKFARRNVLLGKMATSIERRYGGRLNRLIAKWL